jgi:hypothetical protein
MQNHIIYKSIFSYKSMTTVISNTTSSDSIQQRIARIYLTDSKSEEQKKITLLDTLQQLMKPLLDGKDPLVIQKEIRDEWN